MHITLYTLLVKFIELSFSSIWICKSNCLINTFLPDLSQLAVRIQLKAENEVGINTSEIKTFIYVNLFFGNSARSATLSKPDDLLYKLNKRQYSHADFFKKTHLTRSIFRQQFFHQNFSSKILSTKIHSSKVFSSKFISSMFFCQNSCFWSKIFFRQRFIRQRLSLQKFFRQKYYFVQDSFVKSFFIKVLRQKWIFCQKRSL